MTATALKAIPKTHDLNGLSVDASNIAEIARFCTERLRTATDDLVPAYLTIGKQLAGLRRKLKKTTPRGDNEHIGWVQAFKQTRTDGQPIFPFKRTQAENYILIHEFFDATAVASKNHKQLPISLKALLKIVRIKFSAAQIEQAIADKTINRFSEEKDITKLGKKLGLLVSKGEAKRKLKQRPKRERIAEAFEVLAKLGLTIDDLVAETVPETGGKR